MAICLHEEKSSENKKIDKTEKENDPQAGRLQSSRRADRS